MYFPYFSVSSVQNPSFHGQPHSGSTRILRDLTASDSYVCSCQNMFSSIPPSFPSFIHLSLKVPETHVLLHKSQIRSWAFLFMYEILDNFIIFFSLTKMVILKFCKFNAYSRLHQYDSRLFLKLLMLIKILLKLFSNYFLSKTRIDSNRSRSTTTDQCKGLLFILPQITKLFLFAISISFVGLMGKLPNFRMCYQRILWTW